MGGLGKRIGLGRFVRHGSNVNQIDYTTIIASLNLLTDTLDTAYDGTNPILVGMETDLDTINAEIIIT
jgi:hypothetical protein